MAVKGQETKNRLMDSAEKRILNGGFTAMSIEDVITDAGISKGGFFYHFESKNDLVHALMKRYRESEAFIFSDLFDRARELTPDPLQQMLVFIKLFAEMMTESDQVHPGCLVASITYESQQVNEEVRNITADIVKDWRSLFQTQLDLINETYNPSAEVASEDMADMLSTIIEGGIVVSRALDSPLILSNQLLQYRTYLELLYRQ